MKIVIAGTSSGIGRFLADRLISADHHVWGLARSVMPSVRDKRWRTSICDLANWDDVSRAANAIAEDHAWGTVDALILCAARQDPIGSTTTLDPLAWSATIRVNLDGTLYMIRAFFHLLRVNRGKRAKVLCFSGGGATKARPYFSAYAVSKTAVVRLVETLAEEWADVPIDINAIAPGALPTRMIEEIVGLGAATAGEAEIAAARETLAQGDKGFERVGELVDFLLSSKSDGISGKLISAPWDPWEKFPEYRDRLQNTDLFTLRRIIPADRGEVW
jgi:NAD(P)-dependent dehydrogenase (short-subunit alcohol dehydrogenase family)